LAALWIIESPCRPLGRGEIAVVLETARVHNQAIKHLADNAPLKQLDEGDDFVATRYRQGKSEEEFQNYEAEANPTVTEFYRQNHARQTFDFVLQKKLNTAA